MQLTSPVIITPRLMPGLKVGDGFISIEYSYSGKSHAGSNGRVRWRYFIDLPDGEYTNDDLQSGCQGGTLQEGLASLCSFLSACAEAVSYRDRSGHTSENEELFPNNIGEWASYNSDELSMLAIELEETKGLIQE